jgi:hypothetical protein
LLFPHHEWLVVRPLLALFLQEARFSCRRHVLIPAVFPFVFLLLRLHPVVLSPEELLREELQAAWLRVEGDYSNDDGIQYNCP